MSAINKALRQGDPRQTTRALMNPDAQLPDVFPFASELYQRELAPLQEQSPEVQGPMTGRHPLTKLFSSSTRPEDLHCRMLYMLFAAVQRINSVCLPLRFHL